MATNLAYDATAARFYVEDGANAACLEADGSGRFAPIVGLSDGKYCGVLVDEDATRWYVSALITAVISGWTATHTGMPSLQITGPRTVRSGDRVVATVADGETVLVSDPLASPGENMYTDGETTITLSRRDDGNLITDQDGRQATHVAILGDDEESLSSGAVTFGESGAVRWPIRTPKRTGTIEVRTDGRDATDALRNLVESRKLLVAVHSEATCQIPDCDIPSVRSFVQSGRVSNARDGVVTRARRKWDIPYRETAPTSPEAPVITWGEYADASDGVFTNESYEELCTRIAGMPA